MSEPGYNSLELEPVSFSLGALSREDLQRLWLCHLNGDAFAKASQSGQPVIATTGFGMSGVPHTGTLSQILRALRLQRNGIPVQIVLGDLDAYNGRNKEFEYTLKLSNSFRNFILKLGFNPNPPNSLRSQYESLSTLRLAYLICRYIDDKMFVGTEEDLHELYLRSGKVDPIMTYRRKLSINLMTADFLELVLEKNFDAVLVMLGFDEHRYAMFGRNVFDRIVAEDPQKYKGKCYAAIFSSMMRGLNGYEQMSKSFSNSGITVDMSYNQILDLIENGEVVTSSPDTNVVYQLISTVSLYDSAQIKEAYDECSKQSARWKHLKRKYALHLADICALWINT